MHVLQHIILSCCQQHVAACSLLCGSCTILHQQLSQQHSLDLGISTMRGCHMHGELGAVSCCSDGELRNEHYSQCGNCHRKHSYFSWASNTALFSTLHTQNMLIGYQSQPGVNSHVCFSPMVPSYRPDQAPPGVPYPTHVPLNPLQKGAVAGLSALGALLRYNQPWVLAVVLPIRQLSWQMLMS